MAFMFDVAKTTLLNPTTLGVGQTSSIDWVDDNIYAVLQTGAAPSAGQTVYNTTNFGGFPSSGGGTSTGVLLTGKNVTAGKAIAGNVTFTAVANAFSVTGIVIYKQTVASPVAGVPILYLDSAVVSGLPVTANGGDITITFDATNGVFRLT